MVRVANPIDDREGSVSGVLGELQRAIARAAPNSEAQLVARAELHHAFSFDPVESCEMRLDYEPRCSDACSACHSLWIGTKAGEILRLALASRRLDPRTERVTGGVRALRHVCDRGRVVAGLDTGYLLVFDAHDLARIGGCHVGRALESGPAEAVVGEELRVPLEPFTELADAECTERFTYGITALIELPRIAGEPVELLIAMRTPQLLVIRLEDDCVVVRARIPLPGWSRGLAITGKRGDEAVLCVTRTGELLEWSCRALRDAPGAAASSQVSTHLIPTVVATPLGPDRDNHAAFIGANDGLYIRRAAGARPVHVAVTRGAVLSIDTVTLPAHDDDGVGRTYVALGLEDGRLRVIEQRVLFAWLDGEAAPPDAHDFRIAMGSEPLVLEILDADEATARFVLVALRDHRLRLFHVRSRDAVESELKAAWRTLIEEPIVGAGGGPISAQQRDALLAREQDLRSRASRRGEAALRYLLIDQMLPDWAQRRGGHDEHLVRRACELALGNDKLARRDDDKMARRGDEKVLYGLSVTMGKIAGHDATALIEISMACLSAMPQRDAQRWRAFVSYHLKRFHLCIADPELRTDRALRDDVPRLQHWDRFVRKYVLLGDSFATKQFRLVDLVAHNQDARKRFDALLYATQVARQRYDMHWKAVVRDCDGQPQEILRVDLVRDAAVAVTASAEIVFLELVDGKRLSIIDACPADRPGEAAPAGDVRPVLDRLVPERPRSSRSIRARAARVAWQSETASESLIRIALSWDEAADDAHQASDDRQPALRVTVFELVLRSPRDAGGCEIALTRRSSADHPAPPAADAASRPRDPDRAAAEPRDEIVVHSLFGLRHGDGFLAGLDTSAAPLGLLALRGQPPDAQWVMSPLVLAAADGQAGPPAGKTPVRAVTAYKLDDRHYLGAAGTADGSLRFVVFDRDGRVVATHREPMLLVHPVNDVAFSKRAGDPDNTRLCYVGTESGETLCVQVEFDLEAGAIALQQLWRDLHDSPVVVVRPEIRPVEAEQPLLYDDDVMVIATQDGHLSIYHSRRGSPADKRLSVQRNYLFEGMRLDRIDLPGGLTSFAIRRLRRGFLAGYAHGELRYGELYAPRSSVGYDAAEQQLDRLYDRVRQDKLFYGAGATPEQKLAICAVGQIGGDALRNYSLRRQLDSTAWDKLDAAGIAAELDRLLRGLRPEIREERVRIKLIIRRVSFNVLDRSPEDILRDCRVAHDRHDDLQRVGAVCKYFSRYLLDDAVRGQRGAIRVRMSIMHALFRAHVLSLAARDVDTHAISGVLGEALTQCLRDENRIVCVEALRAVAVVLRNISIAIERAEGEPHRRAVRRYFFLEGAATVRWLVDIVLDNFARYRDSQNAPRSTPWSYVTVLLLLIRLLPGAALWLCEQLARRGLGGALESIVVRLRGKRVARLRERIRDLWAQPPRSRDEFIEAFRSHNVVDERLALYAIGNDDRDFAHATGLLRVYRRLARMWAVNDESDIRAFPDRHGELLLGDPIAPIAPLLNQFRNIGYAKPHERAGGIDDLRRAIDVELRSIHAVPAAMRQIFVEVVEHWKSIIEPQAPSGGDPVFGRRVLGGVLCERGNRVSVRGVKDEPQRMVTLLRHRHDADARDAFYSSTRLSRELADRYPDSFLPVYALDPVLGQAMMARAVPASEFPDWLRPRNEAERVEVANTAAVQLARALRCLHEERLVHGAVRAENVFVTRGGGSGRELEFWFGDLQDAADLREPRTVVSRSIPTILLGERSSDEPIRLDLIALAIFIYRLLTGKALDLHVDQRGLEDAMHLLPKCARPVAGVVARMLARRSGRRPQPRGRMAPYHSAAELEAALYDRGTRPPPFERQPLAGRPLAKYDVFISYSREDKEPARKLYQELVDRHFVAFLDEKKTTVDDWTSEIQDTLGKTRAFAILVSRKSRDRSIHAKEAGYAYDQREERELPLHVFSLDGARPAFVRDADATDCDDVNKMADLIEAGFRVQARRPEAIRGAGATKRAQKRPSRIGR